MYTHWNLLYCIPLWFNFQQPPAPVSSMTKAFILALNVCYTARLLQRDEFEKGLVLKLQPRSTKNLVVPGGIDQLRNEIFWYVEYIYVEEHNECFA